MVWHRERSLQRGGVLLGAGLEPPSAASHRRCGGRSSPPCSTKRTGPSVSFCAGLPASHSGWEDLGECLLLPPPPLQPRAPPHSPSPPAAPAGSSTGSARVKGAASPPPPQPIGSTLMATRGLEPAERRRSGF